MKPAILLAVLAMTLAACDRRDDAQDASRSTDTTLAPGTQTSTDPAAALDQAARSTNPNLLDPSRGDASALPADASTDEGGARADPAQAGDAGEREYPTDTRPPAPAPPGG